jgi:hypothetical protein
LGVVDIGGSIGGGGGGVATLVVVDLMCHPKNNNKYNANI